MDNKVEKLFLAFQFSNRILFFQKMKIIFRNYAQKLIFENYFLNKWVSTMFEFGVYMNKFHS